MHPRDRDRFARPAGRVEQASLRRSTYPPAVLERSMLAHDADEVAGENGRSTEILALTDRDLVGGQFSAGHDHDAEPRPNGAA